MEDISPVPIPGGCQTDINEVLKETLHLISVPSESKINLAEKGTHQGNNTTGSWPREHFDPDGNKGKKTTHMSESRISLQNLSRVLSRFASNTSVLSQITTAK